MDLKRQAYKMKSVVLDDIKKIANDTKLSDSEKVELIKDTFTVAENHWKSIVANNK